MSKNLDEILNDFFGCLLRRVTKSSKFSKNHTFWFALQKGKEVLI